MVAYRRGITAEILLSEVFDHSRVTALRHSVSSCAAANGLSGTRLGDFVVAVNELLTNAVRHGGGTGTLTMWIDAGSLVCEVTDQGTGLSAPPPAKGQRPAANAPGGWGLWLAEELTDTLRLNSGPGGTTVRISIAAT